MGMNPLAGLLGGGQSGPPNGQHTISVQPPSGHDPTAALQRLAQSGPKKVTVDTVISDLHQLAAQTDDEQDKQTILKCLTAIQGIKATEAKEKDAALGTTPTHRYLAKQTAARGGGGY